MPAISRCRSCWAPRCKWATSCCTRASSATPRPRRSAKHDGIPPRLRRDPVDSTLKCNGIEVEEYFVGGEIAETFARPLIEQVLDGLKFLDGDGAEVARTREKLAEQAVEVLVATPLPRAVGVSEVNLGVKRVLQPAVLGKLGTAVAGQGVA